MASATCTSVARHLLGPAAAGNRTCAVASTSYAQQPAATAASRLSRRGSGSLRHERRRQGSTLPRRSLAVLAMSGGEIAEVADLKGIRVLKNEDDSPRIEYLVQWKDGSPDTWEPATNLADNLLRDYEQRWWGAVKKGDEETVGKMLDVGADVLARTVNEDRRSAVHFFAARGNAEVVQRLLKAGGEVGLADKEGYTPLHMAAGYMHTTTIAALLAGGADPEQQDREGRSPLELVESLRAALPAGNPMLVQRRMQLENVIQMLMANMFEDVEPLAVLDKRVVMPGAPAAEATAAAEGEEGKQGGEEKEGEEKAAKEKEEEEAKKEEEAAAAPVGEPRTEWLVKFADEDEPVWVDARYVSSEVVDDFEQGLEYADAECVLEMRQRGTMRKYLVRWGDGYPDTWEPEEHVSPDLIALWESKNGQPDASSASDAGGSNGGDGTDSDGGAPGGGLGTAAVTAAQTLQLQGSPS
ncbi:Signal recognition particle protein [Chlorella vulgaris]